MSNPIGFFFERNGTVMQLPVNPAVLKVTRAGGGHRSEVLALGEVNVLRDARLARLELNFLLPGRGGYSFLATQPMPPDAYVAFFRAAQEGKTPLRLVVSGAGVNMLVSVEALEATRRAGDHESMDCRLDLLEYRPYGATALKLAEGGAAVTVVSARAPEKEQPAVYTVVKGDTLWEIARRLLGDSRRYPELAALNGIANPNLIFPGQTLTLPGPGGSGA